MRECGTHAERVALTVPLVASVTNDRRTRLRKPLMKNVTEARKAEIGLVASPSLHADSLSLEGIRPAPDSRSGVRCAMLDGTIAQQAQALADLLWEARA
ncbi:MAG: hypothetical protein N2423_06580 [Novosphingobium sp.]|nr:hypothetical protein [Novosphingobium sp.]